MKIRLAAIQETAAARPLGYFEEVVSRGIISGEWLEISPEAVAELRQKYRPPALPSLRTMAGNAARAARAETSARLTGVHPLTPAEIERRLAICQAPCGQWRESDQRCAACGCYARFKVRLRSSQCPIGKW